MTLNMVNIVKRVYVKYYIYLFILIIIIWNFIFYTTIFIYINTYIIKILDITIEKNVSIYHPIF